ncbi:TPA: glucose-1-phosphate thymidylyltransferase [bacterium]|nr:glucose-1-phosphate thymidylyltransferase [bacterium]
MKALILSGGEGTRLRPITHTNAKQLVPVANKPILFYGLEAIVECGIKDIGMIVGQTKEEIKEACGDGSKWGARITYIEQKVPLGLAHAVKIAQDYIGDEPFVMFLGDNLIKDGIRSFVKEFKVKKPNSLILLAEVKEPQRFGVAELRRGRVIRLIEKPKDPPSNLALVGVYIFDKSIFPAVNSISPSWREELEITDAIQYLIDHNFKVHPHIITGWWKDTGRLEDMLEANRIILDTLKSKILGEVDGTSKIYGKVVIEKGVRIINSTLRGPVVIGTETRIVNSYIGPFTSIYHHVTVEDSEIEHSIILEESIIRGIGARIEDSLIGKNVNVTRSDLLPKAYRFMLGDSSQVGLI